MKRPVKSRILWRDGGFRIVFLKEITVSAHRSPFEFSVSDSDAHVSQAAKSETALQSYRSV